MHCTHYTPTTHARGGPNFTVLMLYPYCTHCVLILYYTLRWPTHTILSYYSYTVLSYCTHTVLILYTHTRWPTQINSLNSTPHLHLSPTTTPSLTPHPLSTHPLSTHPSLHLHRWLARGCTRMPTCQPTRKPPQSCTVHHTPYTILTVHHTPYTTYHTPYTTYHTPCTIHHTPY
jgi:hypothetical protein